MPSPIERTSCGNLNGAVRRSVLPGQRARQGSGFPLMRRPGTALRGYGWAELAERVDVSIATLREWVLAGFFRPSGVGSPGPEIGPEIGPRFGSRTGAAMGTTASGAGRAGQRSGEAGFGAGFAAVDVVRLEVLVRLVRSGVPVARAAELVSTTE